MQTLPGEDRGGHTVPGNKTHVSDLGAKKHYAVLFQKEAQRSNHLPAATLLRGKRARIRTQSTETPNPNAAFLDGAFAEQQ